MHTVEEMKAHRKQQANILKEEEEEAYQKSHLLPIGLNNAKKRSHLHSSVVNHRPVLAPV
jgi:hypothetical protein